MLVLLSLVCGCSAPRSGGSVGGGEAAAGPVTPGVEPTTRVVEPAWVLAGDLCEPETIVLDAVRGDLVVSNICGFKPNGKGYLSRVGTDGTMLVPRWVEGLNAPAGMAVSGRELWVVDLDRVHVFDLDTGQNRRTTDLQGTARGLNDIAVDARSGAVYVSDSANHTVLRVQGDQAEPLPGRFENANGLHLDGGDLLIGGKHLWRHDLESGRAERFPGPAPDDVDGIESDGAGGLLVSVVGGPVWHLPQGGPVTIVTTPGLGSTNHLYLERDRLVIVPTGYDGTLVAFVWPPAAHRRGQ